MMEFSRAINENGLLYVPYGEVKQQEEELKQDLETYKKALEYIDKILFDHCQFSLECSIKCDLDESDCLKPRKGMWLELALQKARDE